MEKLRSIGKQMAEEFVASQQDLFVMTTNVDGEQVTVTIKFSPKPKELTNEQVWEYVYSNQNLI